MMRVMREVLLDAGISLTSSTSTADEIGDQDNHDEAGKAGTYDDGDDVRSLSIGFAHLVN